MALAVTFAAVAVWMVSPYARAYLLRRDLNRPYLVEFGRGSGWHGLETVKVLADGAVVLHRFRDERAGDVETARLVLPPAAPAEVARAIEEHRLVDLQREYHLPNRADGTQWVLRFPHGDREKVVSFDNRFPPEIRRFAADLDRVLAENGSEAGDGRRVTYAPAGAHERDLWDSIRR